MQELYIEVVRAMSALSFVAAVLLWIRRKQGGRSRYALAVASLLAFLLYVFRLLHYGLVSPFVLENGRFSFLLLQSGLLSIVIFSLYPCAVFQLFRVNVRSVLILLSPVCFFQILYLFMVVYGVDFQPLGNIADVILYISEGDVLLRILMMMFFFVTGGVFVVSFFILASRSFWLRWQLCFPFCIMLLFLLGGVRFFTETVVVEIVYQISLGVFIALFSYYELYVRSVHITPKYNSLKNNPEERSASCDQETSICIEENNAIPSHRFLSERLDNIMRTEQPWRNPDLSAAELASVVGTNRNTLCQVIQQKGYLGYREFINIHRIEELIRLMDEGILVSIQDAFYEVGFRSKMTALRYFKDYTGKTPTEYIKNQSTTPQE